VGAGPFPTELTDATGDRLVEIGGEYGTTTGRRRRAGWLDSVALRYAIQVNGITELAVTKLDVLSALEEIQVCVAYRLRGRRILDMPTDAQALAECKPEYETFPGWMSDITQARTRAELPDKAQRYIEWMENEFGVPIHIISVGPERDQTIED
jgi:adenylosuccinate synthase